MIRKIVLKNFQRHRELTLKLSPEVTTIVGPTDAGKSAIIRGLQWVALGKVPSRIVGTEPFVRRGSSQAEVTIRVKGHTVTRLKGKKNAYTVDGQNLKAFGAKLPEEVSSVLKLSELNFQGQHDPALWFSDTPGHVSRQLNEIVDLNVIDVTLKAIADRIRSTSAEERVMEDRIEKLKKQYLTVRDAELMAREFRRLEKLQKAAEEAEGVAQALSDLVGLGKDAQERGKKLKAALTRGLALISLGQRWARTRRLRVQLSQVQSEGVSLAKLAQRPPPSLEALEALARDLRRTERRRAFLAELVEHGRKEFWRTEHILLQLDVEKATLKKEFDTCPLCESPIRSSGSPSPTSTCRSSPRSLVRKRTPG